MNAPVSTGEPVSGNRPHWEIAEGLVPYDAALARMEARVAAIRAGEASELVWLVEHPPTYTAGTSATPEGLVDARFPVFRAGRGGQWTYHGPGQRTGYVMLDLATRGRDIRAYVHNLEDWVIRALWRFNVKGERREGRVGIWVADQAAGTEAKIGAIGVRVRKWVTMHGFAVNLDPDLAHFGGIVPCGIADYGVTSLAKLGVAVAPGAWDEALERAAPAFFAALTE
jgi:lipoyl(octanoyl) transferase